MNSKIFFDVLFWLVKKLYLFFVGFAIDKKYALSTKQCVSLVTSNFLLTLFFGITPLNLLPIAAFLYMWYVDFDKVVANSYSPDVNQQEITAELNWFIYGFMLFFFVILVPIIGVHYILRYEDLEMIEYLEKTRKIIK